MRLFDAHSHLGALADEIDDRLHEILDELAVQSLVHGGLIATTTPEQYVRCAQLLSARSDGADGWRLGLGMHPWWIDGSEESIHAQGAFFEQLTGLFAASGTSSAAASSEELRPLVIGEVGLDAAGSHADAFAYQKQWFDQLCSRLDVLDVADTSERSIILSIHCVRAAQALIDSLDKVDGFRRWRVIFHWFNDDGESLNALRERGAWFSVGHKMLKTKRGRAYATQIGVYRLLLETDEPDETDWQALTAYSAQVHEMAVLKSLKALTEVRGCTEKDLAEVLWRNASEVFDLKCGDF